MDKYIMSLFLVAMGWTRGEVACCRWGGDTGEGRSVKGGAVVVDILLSILSYRRYTAVTTYLPTYLSPSQKPTHIPSPVAPRPPHSSFAYGRRYDTTPFISLGGHCGRTLVKRERRERGLYRSLHVRSGRSDEVKERGGVIDIKS